MTHAAQIWWLADVPPEEMWEVDDAELAVWDITVADQGDTCRVCDQPIPAGAEVRVASLAGDDWLASGVRVCAACWETIQQRGYGGACEAPDPSKPSPG